MTRFVLLAALAPALALGACRSAGSAAGAPQAPGATSPRGAVNQFLAAVNAGDLQAISTIWGTATGPVRDNPKMPRDQLDTRTLLIQRCYKHDSFRVLGEAAGENGARNVAVELSRRDLRASPSFRTVKGPGERWFVEDSDFGKMQTFCADAAK